MVLKKTVVSLAALAAVIGGCSSYQKELLPSIKSVALLGVNVSTDIYRPELTKPDGIILLPIGTVENFDMKAVANNLKDILRSPEAKFPFQFAPEDLVLKTKSVMDNKKPLMTAFAPFVEAEGYCRLREDSDDIPNAIKDLPSMIEGVGFLYAKYSILKKTQDFLFNNGTASLAVEITVYIKDRQNRGVVMKSARVESKDLLKFDGSKRVDTSNFLDVCKDINAQAIAAISKTIND